MLLKCFWECSLSLEPGQYQGLHLKQTDSYSLSNQNLRSAFWLRMELYTQISFPQLGYRDYFVSTVACIEPSALWNQVSKVELCSRIPVGFLYVLWLKYWVSLATGPLCKVRQSNQEQWLKLEIFGTLFINSSKRSNSSSVLGLFFYYYLVSKRVIAVLLEGTSIFNCF